MSEKCSHTCHCSKLQDWGSGGLKSRPGSADLWGTTEEEPAGMKVESYHSIQLLREVTKALAEPVTCSGFPKEDAQANRHPFTGELIPLPYILPSPEPLSPSNFLPHYLTLSFLKCPIVSRRHLHTCLWAGDLVKALWPPRKANYTFILPPIDIYNLKKKQKTNDEHVPENNGAQSEVESCKTFSS